MAFEKTAKDNLFQPRSKVFDFDFDNSDVFKFKININGEEVEYTIEWKALKMAIFIVESFENTSFFEGVQLSLGENVYPEFVILVEQTEEGLKKTITLLIPIQTHVEGPVFKIILDLLTYYSLHGIFPDTAFEDIHKISLKMVFEVYKASNFLNSPELLDGCAVYIASLIKNKTKAEIIELFSLPQESTTESSSAAGGGPE
jgi:hypothetical protein